MTFSSSSVIFCFAFSSSLSRSEAVLPSVFSVISYWRFRSSMVSFCSLISFSTSSGSRLEGTPASSSFFSAILSRMVSIRSSNRSSEAVRAVSKRSAASDFASLYRSLAASSDSSCALRPFSSAR